VRLESRNTLSANVQYLNFEAEYFQRSRVIGNSFICGQDILIIICLVLPDRWYVVIQGRHWSRCQSKTHEKPACFRQVFIIRIKSHSILPRQFSLSLGFLFIGWRRFTRVVKSIFCLSTYACLIIRMRREQAGLGEYNDDVSWRYGQYYNIWPLTICIWMN